MFIYVKIEIEKKERLKKKKGRAQHVFQSSFITYEEGHRRSEKKRDREEDEERQDKNTISEMKKRE